MRFFTIILLCILAIPSSSVQAGDPNQIFSTILGEIGRQIEHKQRKKQLRRLRPLLKACANLDVDACDRAARFPNLTDEARAHIARLRHNAEIWPAFNRNFQACQKWDRDACQAALAYPYLADADRAKLWGWNKVANERHEALETFRLNERECRSGSIVACDVAIKEHHLDESVSADLERQRDTLQQQEKERRAREQIRQAFLARFRQHQSNCHAGSIAACDAAISLGQIDKSAIPDLERQRDKLKLAERQRIEGEQRHQAAIQDYEALHSNCSQGNRGACQKAIAHPQVRATEMAFLQERERELAPFTERVANFFAQANSGGSSDDAKSSIPTNVVLLGVMTVLGLGAGAGTFFFMRNRGSASLNRPEPSPLSSQLSPLALAEPSAEETNIHMFALTGHLPTDIRRAIILAQE